MKKSDAFRQGPDFAAGMEGHEQKIFSIWGPIATALAGCLVPTRKEGMRARTVCGHLPQCNGPGVSIQHTESDTRSIWRELGDEDIPTHRSQLSDIATVGISEVKIVTAGEH